MGRNNQKINNNVFTCMTWSTHSDAVGTACSCDILSAPFWSTRSMWTCSFFKVNRSPRDDPMRAIAPVAKCVLSMAIVVASRDSDVSWFAGGSKLGYTLSRCQASKAVSDHSPYFSRAACLWKHVVMTTSLSSARMHVMWEKQRQHSMWVRTNLYIGIKI